MGLLSSLEKLITEHGSAAILRERLALLRDQVKAVEDENADLRAENTHLKNEVAGLRRKLEEAVVPEEFVEYRGILFRRGPSGDFEPTAFCPQCKSAMFSLANMLPFKCSLCNYVGPIAGKELPEVLVELRKRSS